MSEEILVYNDLATFSLVWKPPVVDLYFPDVVFVTCQITRPVLLDWLLVAAWGHTGQRSKFPGVPGFSGRSAVDFTMLAKCVWHLAEMKIIRQKFSNFIQKCLGVWQLSDMFRQHWIGNIGFGYIKINRNQKLFNQETYRNYTWTSRPRNSSKYSDSQTGYQVF